MLFIKVRKDKSSYRFSKKRCGNFGKSEFFYTGFTGKDLSKRINEHLGGKKSKYLHSFNIIKIIPCYAEEIRTYKEALTREKQIKRLPSDSKWKLLSNDKNTLKYNSATINLVNGRNQLVW